MALYLVNLGIEAKRMNAVEQRIRRLLPDLIRVNEIDDIAPDAAAIPGDATYVLMAVPAQDQHRFGSALKIAERHHDTRYFVLISDEISATDYKALTRTGRADWVSLAADPEEILEIISRHRRSRAAKDQSTTGLERKARAASFVPSAGGVGNSTLTVETAIYLKTRKATRDRATCIIDLDFQSSHVCDILDIEPRLKIQEISSDPERLDEHLFEIFISRHASGIHVFAAPRGGFDYCALDVTALDAFISMAAARYDTMLIDLPVTKFSWTEPLLAASDRVVVTGLNTVPGLRQIAETIADIRRFASKPERVAVAINRCERRLIGGVARRRHVESLLADEQVFYVGNETAALQSINTGMPMMMGKRSAAFEREIAAIAAFCSESKPVQTAVR